MLCSCPEALDTNAGGEVSIARAIKHIWCLKKIYNQFKRISYSKFKKDVSQIIFQSSKTIKKEK